MSKNDKIKVVSLFSGIGGFEQGLNDANLDYEVVFASEIDAYTQKSYAANWRNEVLNGDITSVNEKDIPDHDLLLAGFPCQSFSIAGKMLGFEDTRGTLFFDVARILKEKKPKYIVLENVKNLVSHDKSKTINVILHTLNDIGYTVDFSILNSVEAGVPQNRERTYIVGIYHHASEAYDEDIRSKKINELKKKLNKENFTSFNFFSQLAFNNVPMHIKDILDKDVEEKYYFNSDKVKTFIEESNISDVEDTQEKIIKLFDIPREVHNDLERQRRVYSVNGISPTVLARSDTSKILVEKNGKQAIRKITPDESFASFLPKDSKYKVSRWAVSAIKGTNALFTKNIEDQNSFTFSGNEKMVLYQADRILIEVKNVVRVNCKNEEEGVFEGGAMVIKNIPVSVNVA
jgi:DNA (cytosine-5)-methyltransferase 1